MSEVNLDDDESAPGGSPIRAWMGRCLSWLLPSRCLLCQASVQDDALALCRDCRDELRGNQPSCPRCAEPLVQPEPICGRCLRHDPPFAASFAPFRYAWPLDGLISRFKFHGDLAAGRTLAQLFVQRLREEGVEPPSVFVPVPLHDHRLRQRGYDQALELARDVGRLLAVPVAHRLLYRVRVTQAQTELDLPGRRRNVRGAFALRSNALRHLPSGARIGLIDDVMTTGSTLAECARVLRRAGIDQVRVFAIARAPVRRGGG